MVSQHRQQNKYGTLEVIAGPMFSGKTELFIKKVHAAVAGKKKVQVFTHALDRRYGRARAISHSGHAVSAIFVRTAGDIKKRVVSNAHTVAIDEAQFFGKQLYPVVQSLLKGGYHVIVSGLSVTRQGGPFDPIPALLAEAETAIKLTSQCAQCGRPAPFHRHVVAKKQAGGNRPANPNLVGGRESYQALCRNCVRTV